MVGIPEAAAWACGDLPLLFKLAPSRIVEPAFILAEQFRIDAAGRAHTAIAAEDFFAEIGRVRSDAPLMYAGIGAERESPFGRLLPAPSAQVPAVGPFW